MEGELKIICKQIDGFYVEYKMLDDRYVDVRAFKNPDLLEPYLDNIVIKMPFL